MYVPQGLSRKRGKIRIRGNSGLEVTPEYLEKLIQSLIKESYEFVSLDTVYDRLQEKYRERKFISLTFDDGYADNLIHAYPILKKYNIPFTIYIVTSYPDGQLTPWWHPLEDLILKNDYLEFQEDEKTYKFNCAGLSEKETAFHNIRALLMEVRKQTSWPELINSSPNMISIYRRPLRI